MHKVIELIKNPLQIEINNSNFQQYVIPSTFKHMKEYQDLMIPIYIDELKSNLSSEIKNDEY